MKKLILIAMFILIFSIGVIGINEKISIEGKLTDKDGNIVNGVHQFTFRIYDSNNNTLLEIVKNLTVDDNGIYYTDLDINLSFNDNYTLGITVDSDSEMQPRIPLTSSPYSFVSRTAEYLDWSRLLNIPSYLTDGDNDTLYYASNNYLYLANNTFFLNESLLNQTIENLDNDTKYYNLSEFFNDVGYITDGNVNWDNIYNFYNTSSQIISIINQSDFYIILVNWSNIQNIPSGFSDGIDNDTKYYNLSEFLNDVGYITDGNTNWDNVYGFYNSSTQIINIINQSKYYIIIVDWNNIVNIPSGFSDGVDNDTKYYNLSEFNNDLGFVNETTMPDYWINETGDTLIGNFSLDGFLNISDVILHNGGGFVLEIMPSNYLTMPFLFSICEYSNNSCQTNFFLQNTIQDGRASGIRGSFMIFNLNLSLDNINMTTCQSLADFYNQTLKIDCDSNGADLLVQDDMQVWGDIYVRDEEGEYHLLSRDTESLDMLFDNVVPYQYNCSVWAEGGIAYVNITREVGQGNDFAIINNKRVLFNISNPYALHDGTYTNPLMNWVVVNESGLIEVKNVTVYSGNYAHLCNVLIGNVTGSNVRLFTVEDRHPSLHEFVVKTYRFAHIGGATYESGIDISVNYSTADLKTTDGYVWSSLTRRYIPAKDTSNGTVWIWANDPDTPYSVHTSLSEINKYADGNPITNGDYVNLVFWSTVEDENLNAYYVNVEKTNAGSYGRRARCWSDNKKVTEYSIPSQFSTTAFYIARVCMRYDPVSPTFAVNPNTGDYYIDLRGVDVNGNVEVGATSSLTLNDVMSNGATTSYAMTLTNDLIIQNTSDKIFYVNSTGAYVGINEPTPTEELEVVGGLCVKDSIVDTCNTTSGDIEADGQILANNFDIAEMRITDKDYLPGTVMCISVVNNQVVFTSCKKAYDTTVAGVVATNPSIIIGNNANKIEIDCSQDNSDICVRAKEKYVNLLNRKHHGKRRFTIEDINWSVVNLTGSVVNNSVFTEPITLKGEVYVFVTGCNIQPIYPGDLLVSSNVEGVAWSIKMIPPRNANEIYNRLGSPFAKALEPCTGSGVKKIRAWII